MHINTLTNIVSNVQSTFSPLVAQLTDLDPHLQGANLRPYNAVHAGKKVFGRTTHFANLTQDVMWDLIRPTNPVAHVASIDDQSCGHVANLSVVMAVGINYGQFNGNVPYAWKLCDNTGMGPRLNTALAGCGAGGVYPTDFHLVATNFFPWITTQNWGAYQFNSIEEALFLDCVGYKNPFSHLDYLVQALGDSLEYLVFHGANNAVPYLGIDFLKRHCTTATIPAPPKIIFCDNLAPGPQGPGLANLVKWNF